MKQELKELEKKYKELGKEIERLKKPEIRTVRDLKKRNKYWCLDSIGEIDRCIWGGYTTDKERLENGNIYLTEKEADKKVLRNQIESKLDSDSRIAWGGNSNRVDEFCHYIAFYKRLVCQVVVGNIIGDIESGLFGAVNFPSKESLIKSIETHKELMCQYFDVDDFELD